MKKVPLCATNESMTVRQALVHCSQSSNMRLSRWIRSILGGSWQLANSINHDVNHLTKVMEWPSKVYTKSHWLNGFHHQHSLGSLWVVLSYRAVKNERCRQYKTRIIATLHILHQWLPAIGATWPNWNCCETCRMFCSSFKSFNHSSGIIWYYPPMPGGIGTSTYTFHWYCTASHPNGHDNEAKKERPHQGL